MLNGRAARVKGILDKALGVGGRQSHPVALDHSQKKKKVISRYSLKHFARDDSMYGSPESIRASMDREMGRMKLRQKEATEKKVKDKIYEQVSTQSGTKTISPKTTLSINKQIRQDWVLRDDLDD